MFRAFPFTVFSPSNQNKYDLFCCVAHCTRKNLHVAQMFRANRITFCSSATLLLAHTFAEDYSLVVRLPQSSLQLLQTTWGTDGQDAHCRSQEGIFQRTHLRGVNVSVLSWDQRTHFWIWYNGHRASQQNGDRTKIAIHHMLLSINRSIDPLKCTHTSIHLKYMYMYIYTGIRQLHLNIRILNIRTGIWD